MTTPVRIQPDPAAALSQAVATSVQRALRHAREAQEDGLSRCDVTAVHEFRKALRRARGIVGFARPLCTPETYAQASALLRAAFRSTGALRDSAVGLKLLDGLYGFATLDPPGTALRDALSSGLPTHQLTALVLKAAAQMAAEALPVFQSGLDETVVMDRLELALARSNRRVRRAFRHARASGGDEDFHEWRKRLKDWRAVNELIDAWSAGSPVNPRGELAMMAKRFGALTDLILLKHALQAQTGGATDGPLLRTLERRISARKRHLLQWGERQHAVAPGLVAARLRGALEVIWSGPTTAAADADGAAWKTRGAGP